MRYVIIGCGGSGKTHLANQLAVVHELPLTHLDAVYYDEHWNPLSADEFEAIQRRLVAGSRWIIEGNYASTLSIRLAAADIIVFLDLPALTCLLGVLQRRLRYRGGQHGNGVYDRITWSFVKYIWGYRARMRPRIRALLAEHGAGAELIALTSRRQATRYLTRQRTQASASMFRGVFGPVAGIAVSARRLAPWPNAGRAIRAMASATSASVKRQARPNL